MPKISVVIPSYNQPVTIQNCLQSVLRQDFQEAFEVVIVDSSKQEQQKKIATICAADERVRLVPLAQQTYPGAARNIGIKAATAPIIALIDSDCEAAPDWLSSIYRHLEEGQILTGVIENGTPKSAYGTCSYLVEFNHFIDTKQEERIVEAAATCNFACHKAVFEQVGYFTDDRAFEDFLFCDQFKKQGGQIVQAPGVRITHLNKTKLADIRKNQEMLGRLSAIVRRKNGLPPQLIFRFPPLAFGLLGFRYFSILSRVYRTRQWFNFLRYTPIVLYLLFYWSLGFYRGASSDLEIS